MVWLGGICVSYITAEKGDNRGRRTKDNLAPEYTTNKSKLGTSSSSDSSFHPPPTSSCTSRPQPILHISATLRTPSFSVF